MGNGRLPGDIEGVRLGSHTILGGDHHRDTVVSLGQLHGNGVAVFTVRRPVAHSNRRI